LNHFQADRPARRRSGVLVQKVAMVSEPLNEDAWSLFSVTCISPASIAGYDDLREQDIRVIASFRA
ncbi:MAG: hypothetical protein M3Y22_16020, partial [Pseudomonadota bacterium]|nr:hypothetical protein [Pseudomonadota bacterium]